MPKKTKEGKKKKRLETIYEEPEITWNYSWFLHFLLYHEHALFKLAIRVEFEKYFVRPEPSTVEAKVKQFTKALTVWDQLIEEGVYNRSPIAVQWLENFKAKVLEYCERARRIPEVD